MALNFPSTPTVNDTYTFNNKTWTYTGNAWELSYGTLSTNVVVEAGNLYFTNARSRAAISVTGSGTYDSANGIITVSGGSTYGDSNVALLGYATNANVALKANVADLKTANVAELTNLYYTNARATAAVTNSTLSNITLSGNVSAGNVTVTGSSRLGTVTSGTWNGSSISTTYTDAKIASVSNTTPISATTSGNAVTIGMLTSGVSAGTYGNATIVPTFTVDTYGRVTSVSNTTISSGGSSQWTTTGSDIYYNTGNVGIGTSSPGTFGKFAIRGATTVATFGATSAHFSDAATGSLYITHDTNKIFLKTDGDLNLFANNADAIILSTNATERLRIPSDAAGITFPATQVASSNANTLDDYEEGTWTPVLTRTGSSYTFGGQGGVYTKIGNLVTVQFSCDISAITTQGTGYNSISGFPFAPYVYAGAGRSTAALSLKSVLSSATSVYYAAAWFFADGSTALQTDFTTGSFSGSITYTV